MPEVVGEGVVHIRTDTTGTDVAGAGATAGKGYTKGFLGSLKSLAVGIGGVLAAQQVIGFAKEAVAEGREAQKVGAATEQIIKTTGGTANVTAGQVSDLAAALSAKVGVDDEAIQSGANLLLTFKNVRNEAGKGNDVFDRTVASTQDLAAAGFGSIESASKGLGKALNDPLKGITALGRAGVTFTDAQKEQIKGLVESGDLLSAQKIILGEVESQVGGVAEATATSSEKAQVAWGNLKEQIGTALLPVLDSVADTLAGSVIPFLSETIAGTNGLGQTIGSVFGFIGDAIGFLQGALSGGAGGGFLDSLVSSAQAAIPVIQDGLGQAFQALAGFAQTVLPVIADTFLNQVLPAVIALVSYAQANLIPIALQVGSIFINDVLPALAAVATLIYGTVYPALIQIVTAVAQNLKPVFDQLVETFQSQVLPTLSALYQTITTQLIPALQPVIETVLSVVGAVLKLAAAVLGVVLPVLIQFAGFIFSKVVPAVIAIIVKAVEFVGWLIKIGTAVASATGTLIGFGASLVKLVNGGIRDVVDAIASLPGKIIDLGGRMLDAGSSLMGKFLDGLKSAATGAGGVVSGIASAAFDSIKALINNAIDAINAGIPNSLGKGPLTVDLPDNPIPRLAYGTQDWRGGVALVGERGPELVALPPHTSVTPNNRLGRALDAQGAAGLIDYAAMAAALIEAGVGRAPQIAVTLPTGDPEAAGMAVYNRFAAAGSL